MYCKSPSGGRLRNDVNFVQPVAVLFVNKAGSQFAIEHSLLGN